MRCLCRPDGFELRINHRACRIEFIPRLDVAADRAAGAHCGAELMTAVEEFAERARAARLHRCLQSAGRGLDRAGVLVALLDRSIGKQAAPLVEVKQRPADMMQRQHFIERFRAETIGIEAFQSLSGRLIGGHQAVLDQQAHQLSASLQIAVSSSSCTACEAATGRIGLLGLRVTTVGENPDAARAKALGLSVIVEPDHEPSQRIGAEIHAQTVGP